MPADLANHVALITGAGRGIGRATAVRLARAGCDLALVSRTASQLAAVAAEVAPLGVRTLTVTADVTDDAQIAAALEQVSQRLGSISILVNNAGVAPPRTPVSRAAVADWDRTLATCLRAPMLLSRLVLADMLARKRGAIVNVASIAAHGARPGEAAYAAAKAGLLAFSRALFAEVRDSGIRVVAICPGYVDTAFVPPNRRIARDKFLRPEDVAEAIFLALTCPPSACPTELVIEPQFDPERT